MANLRADNLTGSGGRNAIDGSVFFGGEENQLQSATSSDFAFGTGAYTLEFWVKSGRPSGENGLFGSFTSSAYGIGIWHNGANLYFEERQNSYNGSNPRVTYTTFAWNKWNHLAMSRDSTSGTMRAFVNGVQVGTVTSNLRDITATSETTVGHNGAAGNNAIAYISNFRLNNTQLYTAAFTPPTEKLKPIDGTVLLCCQDSDNPLQEATGKTITGAGGVDINETEYVTNGTFGGASYSPAWTAWGNTTTAQNGGVFIERTSTLTGLYQQLPSTSMPAGQYKLRGQISNKTGPGGAMIRLSSASQGNGTIFFGAYASPATSEVIEHTFTYSGSGNLYMNLMIGNNTGSADFSNISFRQVYTADGAPKVLPPVGVDVGVTFDGDTKVNTQQYMYFPTGDTSQRGRGRAVSWWGIYNTSGNYTKDVDYFDIQSLGTTTKFGEISDTVGLGAGMSSSTRGVFAGGTKPGVGNMNLLEYITIATTGNAVDFGGVSTTFRYGAGISNQTRGLIAGAYQGSGASGTLNTIQYITIANLGDTVDFGDLVANSGDGIQGAGSCSSTTRGITFGGGTPTTINEMNYITIMSTGNSVDFGDLSAARYLGQGVSSSTRGVVGGGDNSGAVNIIEYITIATTGNATDFGDLMSAREHSGSEGGSNGIRGVFVGGGDWPAGNNTMEYITIATTGNTKDFGDSRTAISAPYGSTTVSDCHGGLS